MGTSVEVDDESLSRLEELRAVIRLRSGVRVTREELLARLIERGHDEHDDLVDAFHGSSVPLTDDQKEAFFANSFASGTDTREVDIDRILYERAQE